MPTTPRGLLYPDSSAHTRLWEHLQGLADSIETALSAVVDPDAWTAYTPILSAAAGAAGIGNGSAVGAKIKLGRLVVFRFVLTMGTTTTYGTPGSQLRVSLPEAAAAVHGGRIPVEYTSGASSLMGSGRVNGSLLELWSPGTAAGGFDRITTNAVPFGWANGTIMSGVGSYESAA